VRIAILAIGRLSRGPERDLVADYVERASATGRALGLGPVDLVEVDSRKPGKPAEGEALRSALDSQGAGGATIIACDEHGRAYTSRAFASRLGGLRDAGVRRVVFLIGGADGLAPSLLDLADETLCFGIQTWPHALARVMLSEQIYRAATILAGGPYHRD
jgi:23S rRNA (pseudouridine1915-N3)-methyltransferase